MTRGKISCGWRATSCKRVWVSSEPSRRKGRVAGTVGTSGWGVAAGEALLKKVLVKKKMLVAGGGRRMCFRYLGCGQAVSSTHLGDMGNKGICVLVIAVNS